MTSNPNEYVRGIDNQFFTIRETVKRPSHRWVENRELFHENRKLRIRNHINITIVFSVDFLRVRSIVFRNDKAALTVDVYIFTLLHSRSGSVRRRPRFGSLF